MAMACIPWPTRGTAMRITTRLALPVVRPAWARPAAGRASLAKVGVLVPRASRRVAPLRADALAGPPEDVLVEAGVEDAAEAAVEEAAAEAEAAVAVAVMEGAVVVANNALYP